MDALLHSKREGVLFLAVPPSIAGPKSQYILPCRVSRSPQDPPQRVWGCHKSRKLKKRKISLGHADVFLHASEKLCMPPDDRTVVILFSSWYWIFDDWQLSDSDVVAGAWNLWAKKGHVRVWDLRGFIKSLGWFCNGFLFVCLFIFSGFRGPFGGGKAI